MEAMSDRSASPGPKRRKGGLRQGLASATASTDRAAPKSLLASWLEQSWAWGQLSPQKVQTIAAKAIEDMLEAGCATIPPNLQRLANIGSRGVHTYNNVTELQSIMLPHEDFAALYHHLSGFGKKCFLQGGDKVLGTIWTSRWRMTCKLEGAYTQTCDLGFGAHLWVCIGNGGMQAIETMI